LERLLINCQNEDFSISLLPTTADSGKFVKVAQGIFSWIRFLPRAFFRPNLVHIHFASRGSTWRKIPLVFLSSIFGISIVLHSHGAEFKTFYEQESGPLRKKIIRSFLNRASRLIVLSDSWKEFYCEISSIPEESVLVLRNPVNFSELSNTKRKKTDKVVITSNGRVGKRKGSYDIIDAISLLPEDIMGRSNFVATGDGEVEKLKNYASKKGVDSYARIEEWLPFDQFLEIRANASIFLLPSYDEGLPMAMIEAMAMGQVPIVSPVGGIPEVIRNGENGILVSPGDVIGISEAISRLVRDGEFRKRLSNEAIISAKELDITEYSKKLGRIYNDLARE